MSCEFVRRDDDEWECTVHRVTMVQRAEPVFCARGRAALDTAPALESLAQAAAAHLAEATAGDKATRAAIVDSVTEAQAMLVTVLVTDAFTELPIAHLSLDAREGILLLYHAVLAKVRPRLPFKPELSHVFTAIAQAEDLAAQIRARHGL